MAYGILQDMVTHVTSLGGASLVVTVTSALTVPATGISGICTPIVTCG